MHINKNLINLKMIVKNDNSFSTNSNSNEMIINGLRAKLANEKKATKKVQFNDTVVIYNVESYKQHNKEFCYDEQEGFEEFSKEFPDYFARRFNNYNNNQNTYSNAYRNPNVTRKYVDPECCCIIL